MHLPFCSPPLTNTWAVFWNWHLCSSPFFKTHPRLLIWLHSTWCVIHIQVPRRWYSCFDPESAQFRVVHLLVLFVRFFLSRMFSPMHPLFMSVLTVPFMQSSSWSCITSRVALSPCFPRGPGALGANGKCGCKLSCISLLSLWRHMYHSISQSLLCISNVGFGSIVLGYGVQKEPDSWSVRARESGKNSKGLRGQKSAL